MAVTTCWKCRATIRGPVCDMCGARQSEAGQGGALSFGGSAPPGSPMFTTLPTRPTEPSANALAAVEERTAAVRGAPALPLNDLLLALVGGVVCGVLGALLWAYLETATGADLRFFNFALGVLVGVGVLVGANGERHPTLVVLAAVLGLGTYLLALYFRLSLLISPPLTDGSPTHDFFALALGAFPGALWEELRGDVILWLHFLLVPFFAAGTIYKWSRPRTRQA